MWTRNNGNGWRQRWRKTKFVNGACAFETLRTSNESHVETLIYLLMKNTTKLYFWLYANGKSGNIFDLLYTCGTCENAEKNFPVIFSSSDAVARFSRSPGPHAIAQFIVSFFILTLKKSLGKFLGQLQT